MFHKVRLGGGDTGFLGTQTHSKLAGNLYCFTTYSDPSVLECKHNPLSVNFHSPGFPDVWRQELRVRHWTDHYQIFMTSGGSPFSGRFLPEVNFCLKVDRKFTHVSLKLLYYILDILNSYINLCLTSCVIHFLPLKEAFPL